MQSLHERHLLKERSDSGVSATSSTALLPVSPATAASGAGAGASGGGGRSTQSGVGERESGMGERESNDTAVTFSNELFFSRTPS